MGYICAILIYGRHDITHELIPVSTSRTVLIWFEQLGHPKKDPQKFFKWFSCIFYIKFKWNSVWILTRCWKEKSFQETQLSFLDASYIHNFLTLTPTMKWFWVSLNHALTNIKASVNAQKVPGYSTACISCIQHKHLKNV